MGRAETTAQHTRRITLSNLTYCALRDNLWSVPKGVVYLADQFAMVYPQRLADLKGVFSQRELLLMVDAMKHVEIFPKNLPTGVFFHDHVKFKVMTDRYAIKWDVDGDKLIDTLSWMMAEPYTIMSLAIWAWGATHGPHGKTKGDYVKELMN